MIYINIYNNISIIYNISMCARMLSCCSGIQLFATLWTVAYQAPLSMGFSRQEYWSGLPCPPPGHLPNPVIEPRSPALQADSLPVELPGKSIIQLGRHNEDMNLEVLLTKCDGCIISLSWHL